MLEPSHDEIMAAWKNRPGVNTETTEEAGDPKDSASSDGETLLTDGVGICSATHL